MLSWVTDNSIGSEEFSKVYEEECYDGICIFLDGICIFLNTTSPEWELAWGAPEWKPRAQLERYGNNWIKKLW